MLRIAGSKPPEVTPLTLTSTTQQARSFLLSNICAVRNTDFYRADTRPPDEIKRNGFVGTSSNIPGEIRAFDGYTVFASPTLDECKKFVGMIDHEDNPLEYHFYKFNVQEGQALSFASVQDKESLINALAIFAMHESGLPGGEAEEFARFAVNEHYLKVNEVQVKGPINGEDIEHLESAIYGE